MKIKNEKDYNIWKSKNTDPYGGRCFSYAEDWANSMEKLMAEGKQIKDIADRTSEEVNYDGITGLMYGVAVQILVCHWEHGEELKKWHNGEYNI